MDRTVLIGLTSSGDSQAAAVWAAAYARDNDTLAIGLHVLTYNRELMNDLPPTGLTKWRAELRELLNGEWVAPFRANGVNVLPLLLEADSVAAGFGEVANEHAPALIVVGAGHRAGHLGSSVADRLVHMLRRPVVAVPHGWTDEASGFSACAIE